MDLGALPVLITLGVVILLFYLLRRRGGSVRHRPEMVQSLIYEVRLNQALVETFYLREKPRRFESTHWQLNKDKLDFLEESLQNTLDEVFDMVADFNQQIKTAKKAKMLSQLNLDVNELKEPLAKSKKGLEDWLEENTGHRELPPRYPTLLGSLFGER
jgi:hypothetical protein